MPKLHVDWCTFQAARFAVKRWHYSQAMPSGKLVKVGAWEDGRFIGCVLFGRGAASEIGSPYGLEQTAICELVRVALDTHATPTSRIVALALRMLKKQSPGVRMIVSFADTTQGHHGGIYQAGNWTFVGTQEYHAYRVLGEVIHPKTLHAKYGSGGQSIPWLREHVDPHAERIANGEKHKYLMPLDDEMRARVQPLARPYPKRPPNAAAQ